MPERPSVTFAVARAKLVLKHLFNLGVFIFLPIVMDYPFSRWACVYFLVAHASIFRIAIRPPATMPLSAGIQKVSGRKLPSTAWMKWVVYLVGAVQIYLIALPTLNASWLARTEISLILIATYVSLCHLASLGDGGEP